MRTALDHVLRHNTWANGALLDFCRALDPARLDDKPPGTYGSLYGTLQHLVSGEQWYVQLITGELIGTEIRRDVRRTLDGVITVDDEEERRTTSTVGVVLAQLVHHANEHRTQATTILGAGGIEPPEISGWAYGRAIGISSHD